MKALIFLIGFVVFPRIGLTQIYLSPTVGLKHTLHGDFKFKDTERSEKTYPLFGLRASINVSRNVNIFLGLESSKYNIPVYYPLSDCECYGEVSLKALNFNAGAQVRLNNSIYYKLGLSSNHISDITLSIQDKPYQFLVWSASDNSDTATFYSLDVGLGYTKHNIFSEINISRSLYVNATEKESFKDIYSVNFLIGYRLKVFDDEDKKADCPDF